MMGSRYVRRICYFLSNLENIDEKKWMTKRGETFGNELPDSSIPKTKASVRILVSH